MSARTQLVTGTVLTCVQSSSASLTDAVESFGVASKAHHRAFQCGCGLTRLILFIIYDIQHHNVFRSLDCKGFPTYRMVQILEALCHMNFMLDTDASESLPAASVPAWGGGGLGDTHGDTGSIITNLAPLNLPGLPAHLAFPFFSNRPRLY